MSAQRFVGVILLLVALIIYIVNESNKMATFFMWMYILLGLAAMIHFQPKKLDIKGRSIFITGCDTGFGHEFAKALDKLGCRVFAGCLKPDGPGAISLKADCSDQLRIVPLDVTKDESVQQAVNIIREETDGDLWAVVNNAGVSLVGDCELTTMGMYRRVMEVNYMGMVRVTKACLAMIRKSKGRLVNVGSVEGRVAFPLAAGYAATKFAVEGFTDAVRLEMKRWDVQVVLIEPGQYGGVTSILKPIHGKTFVDNFEDMWSEMSEEQKNDYGRSYIDAQIKGRGEDSSTSYPTAKPVVDKLVEAVAARYPRERYLIAGSNKLVDSHTFCASLKTFLPAEVMDYVLGSFLWKIPLPAALQNKNRTD